MMSNSKRARLLTLFFGTALSTALVLSAVVAGTALAWHVEGKSLAERKISKESFSSEGSFKMEIPKLSFTMTCQETSTGSISEEKTPLGLDESMLLTKCVIAGQEKVCTVEPMTINLTTVTAGGVQYRSVVSPKLTLMTTNGSECAWFHLVEIAEPKSGVGLAFGSAAVNLAVSTSAPGFFGPDPMSIAGSSTWRLTGALKGLKWGV